MFETSFMSTSHPRFYFLERRKRQRLVFKMLFAEERNFEFDPAAMMSMATL
jgi:hypothetical protein